MSSVQYIHNKEEFDNAINDANFNVTIVDFTAHWCGPCKFIGPIFEELSGIHNKIKFIKIGKLILTD
jgi:thioredoxin 1